MGIDESLNRELPSDLFEKERVIFAQWRNRQAPFAADGQFIEDGIVHYPTYSRTYPKLLFLLKEPNDSPKVDAAGNPQDRDEWNLAAWLGQGALTDPLRGYKSWEVIARWVHDITASNQTPLPWADIEKQIGQHSVAERVAQFRKIAVVNIKKSGGGGNTNMEQLLPEIAVTRELITSQIRLCDPTVVVCGGTFVTYRDKIAQEAVKPNYTPRGVRWYLSPEIGIPVIDYPHYTYFPHLSPAVKPAMHYGLVDAVLAILSPTVPGGGA